LTLSLSLERRFSILFGASRGQTTLPFRTFPLNCPSFLLFHSSCLCFFLLFVRPGGYVVIEFINLCEISILFPPVQSSFFFVFSEMLCHPSYIIVCSLCVFFSLAHIQERDLFPCVVFTLVRYFPTSLSETMLGFSGPPHATQFPFPLHAPNGAKSHSPSHFHIPSARFFCEGSYISVSCVRCLSLVFSASEPCTPPPRFWSFRLGDVPM